MTGRRERERKAARERYGSFTIEREPIGPFFIYRGVNFGDRPQPRAGEKFAVDFDGTIILHPSQWKVVA